MKTKRYYADRVILGLQNAYPNIDFKIQPREVFLVVDDIVNAMAKDNYFENWKIYGPTVDEQFITEWSGDNAISVVDIEDQPSYLVLPAEYVALPGGAGLSEVWPLNYEFGAVKLRRHEDVRRTRRLMSGNMQGELSACPKMVVGLGWILEFDQCEVSINYSEKFGVRQVVHDSTAISETAPYPVPANLSDEVIKRAIMYFMQKRAQPTDTVRDSNDMYEQSNRVR
jgi:hypothetical protein